MKMEYAVTAEVTVTLSIITVRNVTRRSEMHGTIVMAHDPTPNDSYLLHRGTPLTLGYARDTYGTHCNAGDSYATL